MMDASLFQWKSDAGWHVLTRVASVQNPTKTYWEVEYQDVKKNQMGQPVGTVISTRVFENWQQARHFIRKRGDDINLPAEVTMGYVERSGLTDGLIEREFDGSWWQTLPLNDVLAALKRMSEGLVEPHLYTDGEGVLGVAGKKISNIEQLMAALPPLAQIKEDLPF